MFWRKTRREAESKTKAEGETTTRRIKNSVVEVQLRVKRLGRPSCEFRSAFQMDYEGLAWQ